MPVAQGDPQAADILVIGAGIVGASIAACAASTVPLARVLLLEAEPAPGSHSTGRSAALFTPAYGPPQVRALTRASRAFFDAPPPGLAAVPLLTPRPSLLSAARLRWTSCAHCTPALLAEGLHARLLDTAAAQALVPVLRPEAAVLSLLDDSSSDIDVDALLQGQLRRARAAGVQVLTGSRVVALQRNASGWQVTTSDGRPFKAGTVVNAAGAWADELALLAGVTPIGLQPRRRSAFVFDAPPGLDCRAWPALVAADESWYIKPDAGQLLGSPANADPVHAHDVLPEELDIALGIHRIQAATTLAIRRPRRTWAGLRSFVADGEPVAGFAPDAPGFFWAGALGGYGIQSSPAFGQLCAALLLGQPLPAGLLAEGVEAAALAPGRPGLAVAQPPA